MERRDEGEISTLTAVALQRQPLARRWLGSVLALFLALLWVSIGEGRVK
jgi:hypothetical protein